MLNIEFGGLDSIGYDAKRIGDLRQQLRAHLSLIPGVSAVAFASHVPLLGVGMGQAVVANPSQSADCNNDHRVSFTAWTLLAVVGLARSVRPRQACLSYLQTTTIEGAPVVRSLQGRVAPLLEASPKFHRSPRHFLQDPPNQAPRNPHEGNPYCFRGLSAIVRSGQQNLSTAPRHTRRAGDFDVCMHKAKSGPSKAWTGNRQKAMRTSSWTTATNDRELR